MKQLALLLTTIFLFLIGFTGCNNNDSLYKGDNCDMNSSQIQWENEFALYVDIYYEDSFPTTKVIEKTFSDYKYKRMYLVNKSVEKNSSITLLFIFDSIDEKEIFNNQVKKDIKVVYTCNCFDIPYETIDTRYIEGEKDSIEIGETISLEIKGTKNYYVQPFDFNGFLVLPQKSLQEKEYKISDFSQIDLQEIETLENGWLYFHLKSSDYYSLISSIDKISRLDIFEKVEFDKSEMTLIPPSNWEISNNNILEIIETDYNTGKIIVKGIDKGEALIKFDGVVYKLTIR